MKVVYDLSEVEKVAKRVINKAKNKTILFYGNMGVGKTTLIKSIVKLLGVKDVTSSPTFSIVNEYSDGDNIIYHFDFYRLNDESEAYDFGLEEYFFNDNWCLIEWPEKVSRDLLPSEASVIEIDIENDGKRIMVMR
ncbi:tRNA (adenosine(37)-N6)-threonylcarbamoyltransferase complex ATPase subunit type 1 TsaE [Abyssalbus ytuae]|uniref:tRNA threonylcarbamoyladenosine biosynthesis protein TsaE n=1 Tax=Abyssalbus ytuae TaxID=2926907 RepID=A0A9E7A0N3_9FLAO|nr:tRNA (adenosine(37)-N6)-threonylcarbamoyltransferase complex ATPase subunit type 1 TsaE [Abyssalbus ytuae]UOB17541.1 tRNA (adenosine(37)-N6)-threonylcarbamoyltransferase complex ATPase subunit type 1 TsaE [Abyssalbus ytuae]